jgi:hypothetical protein
LRRRAPRDAWTLPAGSFLTRLLCVSLTFNGTLIIYRTRGDVVKVPAIHDVGHFS